MHGFNKLVLDTSMCAINKCRGMFHELKEKQMNDQKIPKKGTNKQTKRGKRKAEFIPVTSIGNASAANARSSTIRGLRPSAVASS